VNCSAKPSLILMVTKIEIMEISSVGAKIGAIISALASASQFC